MLLNQILILLQKVTPTFRYIKKTENSWYLDYEKRFSHSNTLKNLEEFIAGVNILLYLTNFVGDIIQQSLKVF